MDRKLLTAEKILGNAHSLLQHLREGYKLKIVTYNGDEIQAGQQSFYKDYRQESKPLSLEYLEKLYLLQQGILFASLDKLKDAQDSFLTCMELGQTIVP